MIDMEEIGVESSLLDAIIDGKKTVEPRLARDKYKNLKAGDKLSLRRDIWQDGRIVQSIADEALAEILGVFYFDSFDDMLKTLGFRRIIPTAKKLKQALKMCKQFYNEADEKSYGVVALELNLLAVIKQ